MLLASGGDPRHSAVQRRSRVPCHVMLRSAPNDTFHCGFDTVDRQLQSSLRNRCPDPVSYDTWQLPLQPGVCSKCDHAVAADHYEIVDFRARVHALIQESSKLTPVMSMTSKLWARRLPPADPIPCASTLAPRPLSKWGCPPWPPRDGAHSLSLMLSPWPKAQKPARVSVLTVHYCDNCLLPCNSPVRPRPSAPQ